jgi:hypothetical protein
MRKEVSGVETTLTVRMVGKKAEVEANAQLNPKYMTPPRYT